MSHQEDYQSQIHYIDKKWIQYGQISGILVDQHRTDKF